MEYAIQLILPIIGGLMLGDWLSKTYGISPLWTVLLGILGMAMGIRILYKRGMAEQALRQKQHPIPAPPPKNKESHKNAATAQPGSDPTMPYAASKRPPRDGTSLNALHELYQQLDQHPPEETSDFPPKLDEELNLDDPKDTYKPPKS